MDNYYRVKYNKKILGKYNSRDEAVNKCETHAKSIIPVVINPLQLCCASEIYNIELVENKKVIASEEYTAIIALKK